MHAESGLLQIGYKWENVTICQHDIIVKFFGYFVTLAKFSYWSKFPVNIIIVSRVMTIFFYKGLTRNPKIENTLV